MADGEEYSSSSVRFSVIFYTFCSSFMLVANKLSLHFNSVPAMTVCVQVLATVGFILILRATGLSEVDEFDWPRVKVFLPYTLSFVLVLYSNGKAIESSNIETVIVFRAGTPLIVSALDFALLGREIPSKQSLAALAGMAVSVVGYACTDSDFIVNGISAYFWVTVYVLAVVYETVYGKKICQGVKFNAPVWGQVMYCNALGLIPLTVLAFVAGEHKYLETNGVNTSAMACGALALSCVVGVGIAWAVWNCRNQVAATTFTLIGVVCKLISVMLNVLIWDKHATSLGIVWLVVCLGCSSQYRQAPLRQDPDAAKAVEGACAETDEKTAGMGDGEVVGKLEPGEDNTLLDEERVIRRDHEKQLP